MLSTIQHSFLDNILFYQKVRIIRKFSNYELLLFHFFHEITEIYPKNVIITHNIIFFFIENKDYFEAKTKLPYFRKKLVKRVILIRAEETLIRLLFAFFPDPYIHDLRIERNLETEKLEINVGFLSFIERGIAVGNNGVYIKAVNFIFQNYVICEENNGFPINVKCEVLSL